MNCLRCGKEIKKHRHLCDGCKHIAREKEKKKLVFSPNNENVKKDYFKFKVFALTVACIVVAITLCVIINLLID